MAKETKKNGRNKALTLKYLIDNELFICSQLQSSSQFVRFCNERDVRVDIKQLEKFDELGIFKPIARVDYPKMEAKDENQINETQYRRVTQFWFEKEYALEWYNEGLLWDPLTNPFKSWSLFDHELNERQAECYYSPFQIYPLNNLIKWTGRSLRAEWWVSYSKEQISNRIKEIVDWANKTISVYQNGQDIKQMLAYVCQVISNRYYPKTQTDRRSFRIPSRFHHKKWDWYQYCEEWDADKVLKILDLEIEHLKKLQLHLAINARHADPLGRWYGLVSFISLEKKQRLKGRALFVQAIYSMSEMLRFFIQDITGEKLPEPDESSNWRKEMFYGQGVLENELKYLEFLTNQFKLNPKPKLILVVEGSGEEEQLPRLAKEFLGYPFPRVGIDVVNIQGVGGFEGQRSRDKYGALEKFIDDYHRRQSIVFVILDNEGRVAKIKEDLVTTKSKFYPQRFITKEEYIHLWSKNIEFDNFTYDEIARAMTDVAEDRYVFQNSEIAECEQQYIARQSNPLGKLYKEKLNYELEKPKLLKVLFGYIISNGKNEFDENGHPKRAIVKILKRIIELALTNYQPVSIDVQEKNQESGVLGDQIS